MRTALFNAIGDVQLPDVLFEVDSATRFSSILLNRTPRDERELLTVYGALLAHGTDLNARQVVRMIPGVH